LLGRTVLEMEPGIPITGWVKADRLIVQRVRGERGKQYLIRWRDILNDCVWYESLSPRRFKKLSADPILGEHIERQQLIPLKSSRMNQLLAALGKAIISHNYDCPDGIDPKEWSVNLRHAKSRLKPNSDGDVYSKIGGWIKINGRVQQILCSWCRTPLLFGYLLDGSKVKRRKEGFCWNACKMNLARSNERAKKRESSCKTPDDHAFRVGKVTRR